MELYISTDGTCQSSTTNRSICDCSGQRRSAEHRTSNRQLTAGGLQTCVHWLVHNSVLFPHAARRSRQRWLGFTIGLNLYMENLKMNARTKLNASYLLGSLLFAALVGWSTGSILIFGLTTMTLVAASLYTGEIRLNGPRPPRNPYC